MRYAASCWSMPAGKSANQHLQKEALAIFRWHQRCPVQNFQLSFGYGQSAEGNVLLVGKAADYARITEALKAQDKMERVIKQAILELKRRKSEHEFDLQRMCFVTEDALLLCHIAFEISSVPVRLLTKTQIHAMVYQIFERSMAMAGGNNTVTRYWDSLGLHCRTQTPAQCIDGS